MSKIDKQGRHFISRSRYLLTDHVMAKYALLILKSHKGFDGLLQPFLSHFIFFIQYIVASGYTVYGEADG
jgi:hypothetical protein